MGRTKMVEDHVSHILEIVFGLLVFIIFSIGS